MNKRGSDGVRLLKKEIAAMKKLALCLLAVLPLVGGCYAYGRPAYVRGYRPHRYYAPRAVIVAPPPRAYW